MNQHFKTLFKSFSPKSYPELTARPLKDAFRYFFFVMLLAIILLAVLFIPATISFSKHLDSMLSSFDTLELKFNAVQNAPVTVFSKPLVVIDLNKTNMSNEQVLITQKDFFYKKYFAFGKDEKSLKTIGNIKNYDNLLLYAFIFMIPAFLLLIFIAYTLKNLALAVILSLIGFIIFKILSYEIRFGQVFKTAIYSATIMILLEILLLLFFPLFLIPMVLYILLFSIACWFVGQKKFSVKDDSNSKSKR
ncbi:DUF1189 domain-containing protein [Candidatus Woesearchaeota archaeon]|nr:MAG: DUF1189 domain-containing protein [Candidatus Woesearchaeota archaeon]